AANAASGLRDLLVTRSLNSFLEIQQSRSREHRVRVGIDKTGHDRAAFAIETLNLRIGAEFLCVLEHFALWADDGDFAVLAKDGGICNRVEIAQFAPPPRPPAALQREQRTDVVQQQWGSGTARLRGPLHNASPPRNTW